MKKQLRRIRIRRGTEDQRKLVVFEEGEPVFVKDTQHVYIGDNQSTGGIIVTNRNYTTNDSNIPEDASDFSIIHFENTNDTKIIDRSGNLYTITKSNTNCCINIKNHIDNIDAILNKVQAECCNPSIRLVTDNNIDILTDDGNWFKV